MGWSCRIKSATPIKDADMDRAMSGVPGLFGGTGASKNSWGWSAACDVTLDGNVITMSGAGFSAGSHEAVSRHIRRELKKLGYDLGRTSRVT